MKTSLQVRKYLAALLLLGGLGSSLAAQAQVDTYTFAASSGTYTQLAATTATRVQAVEVDDDISGALPIGFAFTYDGVAYTTVYACSNGYLSFNSNAFGELTNEMDLVGADERPLIAPLWDDISGADTDSRARYQTTGTAPNRVFTFEWANWLWSYAANGPVLSFQVKLYEGSNRIEFVYEQEINALDFPSASIGLVGAGTGSGSFLALSDATTNPNVSSVTATDNIATKPATGQTYAFTPPLPSPCPAPRNLSATVSGLTATATWTVAGGGGTFAVIYGPTGFDPATGGTTIGGLTGPTATIPNLVPGSYQFYVVQSCPGALGNSTRSNAGGFSVPCPSAAGLTLGTLTNTTADLSWAGALPTGASYTLIYGPTGFDPATGGTTVTGLTAASTTLTGLTANSDYEVYVNISCIGGGTGTLAGPVAFTTLLTAPANDEPCGAQALAAGPLTASNVGATTSQQLNIPLPACSPANLPKDVWFAFVPSAGSVTVTLTGPAAGLLRVFTTPDCSAGPFSQVFCQAASTNNVGFPAPVTITGLTPGQRYYLAVAGYGSSDVSDTFTLQVSNITSARAQANTPALLVYPNPSRTGQLTLHRETPAAGQATLINSLGQAVLTQPLAAGRPEHTLAVRGLAAGLYTLRVVAGGTVTTRQVVLE